MILAPIQCTSTSTSTSSTSMSMNSPSSASASASARATRTRSLPYPYSLSASRFFFLAPLPHPHDSLLIQCSSSSNSHSHGTVDYESGSILRMTWKDIFKRISDPQAQAQASAPPDKWVASVFDQIENQGKKLTKFDLCKVAAELIKFKSDHLALQVYEWMNDRMSRFWITGTDRAFQLKLIARVRGVSSAEDYFMRIPDTLKDRRIYGALHTAYAGAKLRDKAEALWLRMRNEGSVNSPVPFNVMMTLYMRLNEYDKVEELVSEMRNQGIQLDSCSYNIWLSSRSSQGSAQGVEYVFEQMHLDSTIMLDWCTFSIMAMFYIKSGQVEKAQQFLKYLERRISGREPTPYNYLINHYGCLGNKQEVYRVWSMYKSTFPSIPNWGYHSVISSLTRLGDIEGAEKIYEEWLSVMRRFDPRIGYLIMRWYAKEGCFDEVKRVFDRMVKTGGKLNSASWEILGEAHMKEGRILAALSCFKEAASINVPDNWKPKPANMSSFLELCEKEGDTGSKEIFVGLLRELGCFEDGRFESGFVEKCSGEVGGNGGVEQFVPDDIDGPAAAAGGFDYETEANSLLFE